jgi:Ca2+-binding EF-hand superfamily protein
MTHMATSLTLTLRNVAVCPAWCGWPSLRCPQEALREVGEDPDPEEIRAIIKSADVNNDGTIDYNEFCAMWAVVDCHWYWYFKLGLNLI